MSEGSFLTSPPHAKAAEGGAVLDDLCGTKYGQMFDILVSAEHLKAVIWLHPTPTTPCLSDLVKDF